MRDYKDYLSDILDSINRLGDDSRRYSNIETDNSRIAENNLSSKFSEEKK
jgi:hypothetical protein